MLNLEKGRWLRRRKCSWKQENHRSSYLFLFTSVNFLSTLRNIHVWGCDSELLGGNRIPQKGDSTLWCVALCLQAYAGVHLTDKWRYRAHAKSCMTIQQTCAHCCPFPHTNSVLIHRRIVVKNNQGLLEPVLQCIGWAEFVPVCSDGVSP